MSNETSTKNKKIVLVGDMAVGKTSYMRRLLTGEWSPIYYSTRGCEVFTYDSSDEEYSGKVFEVWDLSWECIESDILLRGWLSGADGAIVMIDLENMSTFYSAKKWVDSVRKFCGDIPLVLCGNKVDSKRQRVTNEDKDELKHLLKPDMYYDLSVKSCYNFSKPFSLF